MELWNGELAKNIMLRLSKGEVKLAESCFFELMS
jgi:hypothetical protein